MSKSATKIKDTSKARNLSLELARDLALDELEKVLLGVAKNLSLELSHVTTLSQKKYPGNRHWHFKEDLKAKGCLDVTYWPDGRLLWITLRNYEPDWVHKLGDDMFTLLSKELSTVES